MTFHYLDSSVAVRIMLGHSASAAQWFDSVTGNDNDRVVSSRILRTEITRVLRRENLHVTDRDQILDYVDTIPLDHVVLQEAEAIIPHIRTLDAIHLASALRSGLEDLVVVTHDSTMKSVAAAIGFHTYDPVTAS